MIVLPPKDSNAGCEVRLLLAECRSPAYKVYSAADAKLSMQYMDKVLFNRLENPKPYGAAGAKSIADIVRAPGQFAGFGAYPTITDDLALRIQSIVDIANSRKDKRKQLYIDFIDAAIAVTSESSIADPTPGKLVSWRTEGSGPPGGSFKLFKSVMGNTYYYI
ncbi:hypothetical protein Q4S45_12930 [Massilia sp. R2A-15]|uniref:hypothetical protein n=1 Tax=Massilia sp. R2A-15 TaxID=3064278 RepID=UPI002733311E|nr:hypothetical protein [Massilia sp. R2A-15]WLI87645.1 hypothetical protein Q4S45_12930 [Massilia sp. R2A-15]